MATAPVTSKFKFAGDGKDPLGDVLADPNRQAISGDTGTFFEAVKKPAPAPPEPTPEPTPAPAPATETSTAAAPVISTSTAPDAKLYAGKFKSVEDLEKSYEEIQKSFTVKAQEAATARKALEEREKAAPKTPEETETERLARINLMLADPDKYFAEQARKANDQVLAETKSAREVAAKVEAWREQNKDVVPYEDYIGVVMHRLATSDPKLDPLAALDQATTAVRAEIGKIREAGRLEALSIQSGATTPAAAKVIVPPPTEHPSPAPMSDQDAYQAHMAELNSNAARVRRQVR